MTKILIRQLNDTDVNDFRAIRLSSLKNNPEMFGSSYAMEVTRPLSIFSDVLAKNVIYAAYYLNKIIGMVIFLQELDLEHADQAHLYGFFVEPEFRNQGIAKQLLQATIQHGQPRVKQIMLSVVATNIAAINLYKKLGFQIDISSETNDKNEIKMIYFY